MNPQVLGLRVAGTIFGLMCLGQILRLLTRAEIAIDGYAIPLWASGLAVVVAGGLSLWLWRLSLRVPG